MAGFKWDEMPERDREIYDVESGYRPKDGGCDLDITGLPAGFFVPPFAPLNYVRSEHKAYVVKNVKVIEAAVAAATSLKIAKGSLAGVMNLTDGTNVISVTAVDGTNAGYDLLTVGALDADIAVNQVLTEALSDTDAKPKQTANRVNYAWTKVRDGASVTTLTQAYSIKEEELYMPLSEWDKETLTSRFMFL